MNDRVLRFLEAIGRGSPYGPHVALAQQGETMTHRTTITLTFRWPMGHRILGLTGNGAKCRNIHGHNWTADIELPNADGQLEFGAVKATIGDWIARNLDHGFAVAHDDPFLDYLTAEDLKHVALDGPPTTERLAALLAEHTEHLTGVRPVRVHLVEGYRNAATWIAQ